MARAAADATVFHAIADPTRRAILELLIEQERPVRDLLARISATQSALSQHLRVLKSAGLVIDRAEGRLRIYAIRPEPLVEVIDWVAHFDRFWDSRLDKLGDYLERTHGQAHARTQAHATAPASSRKDDRGA
jgi:DNA-binding transcriptional ArsR family regulator